jgi:hypothetical protein
MRAVCIAGALLAAAATAFAADAPSRHYSLKLTSLCTPQSPSIGLLLKGRIDGGPVLRLLLDSGAQQIVLDRRAAANLSASASSALRVVGLGAASKPCARVASGTLQIGDLILRDCDIVIVDGKILEGIDGVIPTSLFAGFLVRLDFPGKSLDLDPYPSETPVQDAGYLPARTEHSLFFLNTVLNGSQPGYVLLDTGATYNAISPAAARVSRNYWNPSSVIPLRGGTGDTEGFPLPPGVRFRCGPRVLSADPAVVVNLSEFASHYPFEVTGVLGYPALRTSIVTMNYRDGLVRIEGR